MDAVEAEMDAPVIHTFFLTTLGGVMNAAQAGSAEEREQILRDYSYGLYPAFVNGMLDAMDEDTVLTDGNEPAYYYHDKAQYFQIYHYIRQTALGASRPRLAECGHRCRSHGALRTTFGLRGRPMRATT